MCTCRVLRQVPTGAGDSLADWPPARAADCALCTGVFPGIYPRRIADGAAVAHTSPGGGAGDAIPEAGLWSRTGQSATGGDCEPVDGGQLFYAYSYPDEFVSNSGFLTVDTDMLCVPLFASARATARCKRPTPRTATAWRPR